MESIRLSPETVTERLQRQGFGRSLQAHGCVHRKRWVIGLRLAGHTQQHTIWHALRESLTGSVLLSLVNTG